MLTNSALILYTFEHFAARTYKVRRQTLQKVDAIDRLLKYNILIIII